MVLFEKECNYVLLSRIKNVGSKINASGLTRINQSVKK